MQEFRHGPLSVDHTHQEAPDEVDKGGYDGEDGVALYKLGSTVHGAEEVGASLNIQAAFPGLFLVDDAGVEVCVNGHLFTGHSVQGEAGRNLSHTFGTLGDDDKLYQNQNEEDDKADDYISLYHKFTESLDNRAGVAVVGENFTGRGYV